MALNPEICRWCKNKMKDVCDPCTSEGKYNHLEPHDCSILLIPELPKMRDLQSLPANDRLALMYLHITIIERTMRHSAKEYARNAWSQVEPRSTP